MVFSQVPRARQQLAFDNGSADLLVPASRTAARDALGDFVPLVQVRPTLLSLGRSGPPLERLSDLLATPELRLVVVRGYEYGPVYRETIEQLRQQRRLSEEPNPAGVARALRTGLADLTLMSPNIFIGALVSDPGLTPLMAKLRVEPVAELGWNESGLYLSRARMSAEERQQLRDWFARASKSGRVWQVFNEIYPPHSLDGHMRPVN
jgi:polar amino acid transport system substrate-binding protein